QQYRPPLKRCPHTGQGINFPTHFFRFTGIEDFWICSKCFEDDVKSTRAMDFCEQFYFDPLPGCDSVCDWQGTPRVRQLLNNAVRNGGVDALMEYARNRPAAGVCQGQKAVRGGQGQKWFGTPEIPNFIACEACYEDYIFVTPMASRMAPKSPESHETNDLWSCDLSIPYVRQMFLQQQQGSDLINAIKHRMSLPSCLGFSQIAYKNSRRWFRPVLPHPIERMMVCEACFLDHAGGLPVAKNFQEVRIDVREGVTRWICDFQLPPLKACTPDLMEKHYELWYGIAAKVVTFPCCEQQAIRDGDWYALQHPEDSRRIVDNFELCAACYIGMIEPCGFAGYFRQRRYNPGSERVCDFSTLNKGRHHVFRLKYREMVFRGDPFPLMDIAHRLAPLPVCPGGRFVQNRRWWGMNEFFFCESCYEELGRDSYFAPSFAHQRQEHAEACCDMWSTAMRQRYIQACRSKDLTQFL
ncbi:hypothetical protein DOTSEDRAFT_117938, partial [Dothistroma septosporum NZE10]